MPKIHGPTCLCCTPQTPPFAPCNSRVFVLKVHREVVQHTRGCTAHWLTNTLDLRKNVFSMAALSTETGKCCGITEGGTSLRSQERNIEVASQLTEKLLKGPHKCCAEWTKQTPSVVKTLPKVISKSVYNPL